MWVGLCWPGVKEPVRGKEVASSEPLLLPVLVVGGDTFSPVTRRLTEKFHENKMLHHVPAVWWLTRDGQVPQGAQRCVLNGDVALLDVPVQQLQKLLHNSSVHHVDAVPI